jgi:glycosyltransferase involved in cell wall biosynthesis
MEMLNMSNLKKVSVILTSYNHEEYITEAITSVLNQTYKNFELIIWDDLSTDKSWEVISSFSDPRIRAFQNEKNMGGGGSANISKAINAGFASAEYIAIHHSDDVWETNKLEKQIEILESHPEVGAVFSWAHLVDEYGKPFENKNHFYYKVFEQANKGRHEWLNHFFYKGNALCHPSAVIRKTCYDDVGLYRLGLSQLADFDMWVRFCLKHEIFVIPEKLVRFRVFESEKNVSGNRLPSRIRIRFDYFQVYKNFCEIDSREEFLKVFPSAEKYNSSGGFDNSYALGMVAIEHFLAPVKLFGLQLLFEIINDPERAQKVEQLYGFKAIDFIKLNTKADAFSVELVESASEVKDELTVTYLKLNGIQAELAQIKNSDSYKIALFLQKLKRVLSPPNSMRQRFFSYFRRFVKSSVKKRLSNLDKNDDLELLAASNLFDEMWYLSNNPDVAESDIVPIQHYLYYGGFEGRDPGPNFSNSAYLETYPDVKNSGMNPLVHYLRYGEQEDYYAKTNAQD